MEDHSALLQLLRDTDRMDYHERRRSFRDPCPDDDYMEMDMADSLSPHDSHSPCSDHSGSPPPSPETGLDGEHESSPTGSDKSSSSNGSGSSNGRSGSSSNGSSGKKRKTSGTDANGNAKPVKKRASQACEICRSRKVRCDSEKRHPCTNCADMGLTCNIPESKRRRYVLWASRLGFCVGGNNDCKC